MNSSNVQFSVFTKSWKGVPIPRLGEIIQGYGFDGIEFPLRDGFQVEPKDAEKGLRRLVEQLGHYNLKAFSVAGGLEEHIFSGCAESGIPLIRIMIRIQEDGYYASVDRARRMLEQAVPLCEKYGVTIGIQPHCDNFICDVTGTMRLIESFDPKHVSIIWDAAHDAIAGQQPEYGLDIAWSHLRMVNLKNAYYYRDGKPGQEKWSLFYSSGPEGLASWPGAVKHLKKRAYGGVVCLTAEYSEEEKLDQLVRADIAYAKSLFQK